MKERGGVEKRLIMTTHTHTIEINAKSNAKGLGNITRGLNTIIDLGEKAQNMFENFTVKANIDFGDGISELKGFQDEISTIAKDMKGIESPKLELIDSNTAKSLKELKNINDYNFEDIDFYVNADIDLNDGVEELKAFKDEISSIAKDMKGITSPKLKIVDTSSSKALKDIKGLDAEIVKVNENLEGMSTKGFDNAIAKVGTLTDSLEEATSAAGNLNDSLTNLSTSGLEGAISQASNLVDAYNEVASSAGKAAKASKNIGGDSSSSGGKSSGRSGGGIGASTIIAAAAGTTANSITIDNAATKETNKATMKSWGGDYDKVFSQIDKATDHATVSMNATVPAMNAFMSATGADSKFIGDNAETFTNLGTKVRALGYSEAEANQAMMDLSKGANGAFASLDQYGISEQALKNTKKWSGPEDSLENYMAAVDEVLGDPSVYEGTLNWQKAMMQKSFSRGGNVLGQMEIGPLKDIVNAYTDIDKAMLDGAGFNISTILAGATQATSGIRMVTDAFQELRDTKQGIKDAWGDIKDFYSKVKNAPNTLKGYGKSLKEKLGIHGIRPTEQYDEPIGPDPLPQPKEPKNSPFDPCDGIDDCVDKMDDIGNHKKGDGGLGCDDDCGDDCLETAEDVFDQKKKNHKQTEENQKEQERGRHLPTEEQEKGRHLPDDKNKSKTKGKGKKGWKDKLKSPFGKLKNKLGGKGSKIKGLAGKVGSKIGSKASVIGGIGASVLGSLFGGDEDASNSIIDMEKSKDGTYNPVSGSKLGNIGKGAKNFLGKGVNAGKSILGKGAGLLKGAAGAGKGLAKGLGKGLTSGLGKVAAKVGGKALFGGLAKGALACVPGIGQVAAAAWMVTDVLDMMGIDWFTPLSQGVGAVLDSMGPLGQTIKDIGGQAMDWLGGAGDWFMGGLEQLMNGGDLGEIIMGGLSDIGSWLGGIDWGGMFSGLMDWFGNIDWGQMLMGMSPLALIGNWLSGIDWGSVLGGVGEAIMGALGGIGEWLAGIDWSGIFGGIGDVIGGAFSWLVENGPGIFDGIVSGAQALWDILCQVGDVLSGVISPILGTLGDVGGAIAGLLGFGGESNDTSSGGDSGNGGGSIDIQGMVSGAVEQIRSIGDEVWSIVDNLMMNVANSISNMITTIGTSITTVFQSIGDIISSTVTTVTSSISNMATILTSCFMQVAGVLPGMVAGIFMLSAGFLTLTATALVFNTTAMAGLMGVTMMALTAAGSLMMLNAMLLMATSLTGALGMMALMTSGMFSAIGISTSGISDNLLSAQNSMLSMLSSVTGLVTAFAGLGALICAELLVALGGIQNFSTQAPQYMSTAAQGMKDNLSSGLSGLSAAIDMEMSAAYNALASWGARMVALAGAIGAGIAAAISGGLNQGSPGDVYRAVMNEFKWTNEGMRDSRGVLVTTAGNIGRSIVEGFRGTFTDGSVSSVTLPQVEAPNIKPPAMSNNNSNSDSSQPIVININGDIDSEQRLDKFVKEITHALTFENKRAGRTV